MGQHKLPVKHLQRFAIKDCPDFIWQIDKQECTVKKIPIQAVSQGKNLWSDKTERLLNQTVEAPANRHLDKLANGMPAERLDSEAREAIARYIRVMITRYPERVKREADRFFTSEALTAHLNEHWRALFKPHPIPEVVREHIEETIHRFGDDQFRAEVIDDYDWVWPTQNSPVIAEVLRSEWKVFQPRSEPFVTTDRPAWVPNVNNRDTFELWFPISSRYLLAVGENMASYADERPTRSHKYVAKFPVKHFENADRFVYSSRITRKQRELLAHYKKARPRTKRRRQEYLQNRRL